MSGSRTIALVVAVLLFAGCESSGGDGQTRSDETASSNSSGSKQQSSDKSDKSDNSSIPSGKLAENYEGLADEPVLDAGDVPPVGSTLELSTSEWRKRLNDQQFKILRKNGTEPRGSGKLLDRKKRGIYYCAGCGAPLFSSRDKYESNTGWPSFTAPYEEGRLGYSKDTSMGMVRVEVHCNRCGGHLGHVFDDGPKPTGKRYCINSAAMKFKPAERKQDGE